MTRKLAKLVIPCWLLLIALPASASLSRFQGWAERGGARVVTAGALSTTRVQQSAPGASYTVKLLGTATVASIYSDAAATTPKVCPCAADSSGAYSFYAAPGQYDVYFSASGIGSWVQTITVGGGSVGLIGVLVTAPPYNAVCDDVADDTTAIQSAIDLAGPHQVLLPTGTCKHGPLVVSQERVWIVGQGKFVSNLHFVSAVDGAAAISFTRGASLIGQCGVTDLNIYTDSTPGVQKVGIRWTNATDFTVTRVAMYPFTSNSNSIGLQSRGREFIYLKHNLISADQPISFEDNPTSANIDADHVHLEDLYLLTQANVPAIKFATGVHVTNFITSGTNSCTGGSDCIYNVDTTTSGADGIAVISGWRWEQPSSAGHFLTWSRNQLFRGLVIEKNRWGAGTTMNGIKLRNIENVTVRNNSDEGTLVFVETDSTVRNLRMENNFLVSNATNTLTGQQAIFKINKGLDSTTPDYVDTWYDTTSNTNITSFGKLVELGGLNLFAKADVSVLAGIGNRVTIPLGAGGETLGYIEVVCRGTTLTSGGTVAVSSLGATKLTTGDTNFDVGNVAGKLTIFWESAAQISLTNQTAENMTCGYMHWWF